MRTLLTIAADAVDSGSILPMVSMIGSLGFAVWYAWYVTTVAIPKLMDNHRAEREEMQKRFDQLLLDLRTDFNNDLHAQLVEMKEQRQQFATTISQLTSRTQSS